MTSFLTVDQIAPMFHVTTKTIRLWALQGIIQGKRVGKRWYFKPEAVDSILGR